MGGNGHGYGGKDQRQVLDMVCQSTFSKLLQTLNASNHTFYIWFLFFDSYIQLIRSI